MNKLPSDLRLIISRKVGEDEWDLGIILREFLTEIEAREGTAVNRHRLQLLHYKQAAHSLSAAFVVRHIPLEIVKLFVDLRSGSRL